MTVKELLNIKFSLYGRVYYNTATTTTTLMYWLGKMSVKCKDEILKIRNTEYRLYKEGKLAKKEYQKAKSSRLPTCTPSAIFDTQRSIGKESERTGIIIIDVDGIDNVEQAKKDVCRLPYVFFSSLSVSGAGIFCGVYYNKENDITETFNALYKDFKEIGYIIDNECKDISRARYVSYDDNILIKSPDTEIEMYNKTLTITREEEQHYVDKDLTKEDLRLLTLTIDYLVRNLGYGKKKMSYTDNSSTYDYRAWLNDGYRLSNIGNDDIGLKLFQFISENSDGYENENDVVEHYNRFQHYSDGYTNIGFYFWLAKDMLGDNWKSIVTYNE